MPHLAFTALMALAVSLAMAFVGDRSRRERVSVAIYLMLCCAATTLVGSWAMYWIHR